MTGLHTTITLPGMAINPDLLKLLEQEGLLTVTQAATLLKTSRIKIIELIKDGTLAVSTSPLDRRVRLVRREDVEAIRRVDPASPPQPPKTKKK